MLNRIDELLEEGIVARARSRAIRALNDKAQKIHNFAQKLKLESDITEVSSSEDTTAIVEIQFGNNELFKNSQVVNVTVHDVDDFVVWLPMALSIYLEMENHHKFKNVVQVKSFIKKLKVSI